MNIFEIQSSFRQIFDELEENGGELTPELEDQLSITKDSFKTKVENYANIIKSLNSDIAAIDAEKKRLDLLKKSKSNIVERLSNIVAQAITQFGDETKSGGKFIDYGTGKINVRNTKKVEVNTERTDAIASSMLEYFRALSFTGELNGLNELDEKDVRDAIAASDNGIEFTSDELNNISANLSFDFKLKDLLDAKGVQFVQEFFAFANNSKIKSNISKSVIKDELEGDRYDLSNIAHIVDNQSITIK